MARARRPPRRDEDRPGVPGREPPDGPPGAADRRRPRRGSVSRPPGARRRRRSGGRAPRDRVRRGRRPWRRRARARRGGLSLRDRSLAGRRGLATDRARSARRSAGARGHARPHRAPGRCRGDGDRGRPLELQSGARARGHPPRGARHEAIQIMSTIPRPLKIGVAEGEKIPRKGGPGITRSDLLVINKIDLAPYVGADLAVMERDARRMRGARPFTFTNLRTGEGLETIVAWIRRELTLDAVTA